MEQKPHMGAQGQPKGSKKGQANRTGGGAPGQPVGAGTRNRPCKPHMGAQGQKSAGGTSTGGGPTGSTREG